MKILQTTLTWVIFLIPIALFSQYPHYKTVGETIPITPPPTNYSTDRTKLSISDFNKDGFPDFCIALYDQAKIEIAFQQSDGSFQNMNIPVLANPLHCIVADYNNDTYPDIVVLNKSSHNYDLLINNKNGTFSSSILDLGFGTVYGQIVQGPYGITGDFNGDNNVDLIIGGSFVAGHGDGTFSKATIIYPGLSLSYPYYYAETIVAEDFNKDEKLDLILICNKNNYQTFSYLAGQGNGTFSSPIDYSHYYITQILATDFNNDGNQDIITNNSAGPYLYLGNGDGTFADSIDLKTKLTFNDGIHNPLSGGHLLYEDLDNDNIQDFVVSYVGGVALENYTFTIIKGNVDGTFTPMYKYPGGDFITDIRIADMNRDGKMDILVRNLGSEYVVLLKGNGDFTFGKDYHLATTIDPRIFFNMTSTTTYGMSFLDKNGDNKVDVVAAYNNTQIAMYQGNGDVTFQAPSTILSSAQGQPEKGDLNNDGKDDLLFFGSSNKVSIMLTNPDGSSAPAQQLTLTALTYPMRLKVIDINKDGNQDLLMMNHADLKFEVQLGNGDGTFTFSNQMNSHEAYDFDIADLDNDSNLDLVAVSCSTNTVLVFKGNGTGTFGTPLNYYIATYCSTILVKDFNKDNYPDLVIANPQYDNIAVYPNDGTGVFKSGTQTIYATGNFPESMLAEDFNLDGNVDLVCSNLHSTDLSFFVGLGNGKFLSQKKYLIRGEPTFIKAVDINSDGTKDIAVWSANWKDITFLLSDPISQWMATDPSSILNVNSTYGTPLSLLSYKLYYSNIPESIQVQAPQGFKVSTDTVNFQSYLSIPPSQSSLPGLTKIFLKADTILPAGLHKVIVKQTPWLGVPLNLTAQFTINKANVTATVANTFRLYGLPNPTFTINYTGLKNGDTCTVLDQMPVAITTAAINSNVGTYPIVLSGGYDNNYNLTLQNGTLYINKNYLYIKALDASKLYGEAIPDFHYKITGLLLGEDSTVINQLPTITTTAQVGSSPGTYSIIVLGGNDNNYNLFGLYGTLVINKAPLKVQVKDTSRKEGELNPEFELIYNGFVNGDDESVISGLPTIRTDAIITSSPGIYDLYLNQGSLDSPNYYFILSNGKLTVTSATAILNGNYAENIKILSDPFSELIHIEELNDKIIEVSIIDTKGRTENYNSSSMHTLLKGMLIVRIKCEKNIYQSRIVKY